MSTRKKRRTDARSTNSEANAAGRIRRTEAIFPGQIESSQVQAAGMAESTQSANDTRGNSTPAMADNEVSQSSLKSEPVPVRSPYSGRYDQGQEASRRDLEWGDMSSSDDDTSLTLSDGSSPREVKKAHICIRYMTIIALIPLLLISLLGILIGSVMITIIPEITIMAIGIMIILLSSLLFLKCLIGVIGAARSNRATAIMFIVLQVGFLIAFIFTIIKSKDAIRSIDIMSTTNDTQKMTIQAALGCCGLADGIPCEDNAPSCLNDTIPKMINSAVAAHNPLMYTVIGFEAFLFLLMLIIAIRSRVIKK